MAIDQAQQMIFRNLIFETEVVKQRLRAAMVSHHEQQASECNGEQPHRELWPAYNANVAPSQASTEELFQQTRLVSTAIHYNLRVRTMSEVIPTPQSIDSKLAKHGPAQLLNSTACLNCRSNAPWDPCWHHSSSSDFRCNEKYIWRQLGRSYRCNPRKIPLLKQGNKSDKIDARKTRRAAAPP